MSRTPMEEACDRIVTIYYQYAARSKDPNGDTLDGAEFKKLVDEQFYHLVKRAGDRATVDKLFKELDTNKDGVLSFEEFGTLVARLLTFTNEKLQKEGGSAASQPPATPLGH